VTIARNSLTFVAIVKSRVKVVICWTHISGYMAACWRALASRGEVDFRVIGFKSNVSGLDIKFQDDVVAGLDVRLMSPDEIDDPDFVRAQVVQHDPDIVVLPGWAYRSFRKLVEAPELRRARFVMTMDTPYQGSLRQTLGRYKIAGYLGHIDRVIVPGERAWQLARYLGVSEEKIRRGQYGVDYTTLAPLIEQRRSQPGGWPRRFLFTGRYTEEKGLDILLRAYRAYRDSVNDPWALTCCGTGNLESLFGDAPPGVNNMGFVQPSQLPHVMVDHGTFVLPSRFDPWPLVIVESCAAGLPVIHSDACGSAVELVRPYFNGIGVATGNVDALVSAMRWCHENHEKLPDMGARGQALAAAYSAEAWATRWTRMFQELSDAG
jgi:glycosyltransferase involved in cell wall biosynthesis